MEDDGEANVASSDQLRPQNSSNSQPAEREDKSWGAPMIRCEPRLKVATDYNSARDSGYATGVQLDGTSISSRDESPNPQRGRRIGNMNLLCFQERD